jgi:hypothetical protein
LLVTQWQSRNNTTIRISGTPPIWAAFSRSGGDSI